MVTEGSQGGRLEPPKLKGAVVNSTGDPSVTATGARGRLRAVLNQLNPMMIDVKNSGGFVDKTQPSSITELAPVPVKLLRGHEYDQ